MKKFWKLAKSNLFDSFSLNAGKDSTHRVIQCHSHVRVTVKNKDILVVVQSNCSHYQIFRVFFVNSCYYFIISITLYA